MVWLLAVAALALGIVVPEGVAALLRRLGLVDVPNERSSHKTATLRGGGLAPLAVIAVVWLGVWPPLGAGWMVVAGVVLFGLLGLAEDLRGLTVWARIGGQLAVGVGVGAALVWVTGVDWWQLLLLAPAAVFLINAANFMDGVNGISSFQAIVTGGCGLAVGLIAGRPELAVLGAVAIGAFAGFLPWNFPKAKMFLGDVGSYVVGALMWGIAWWAFIATGSLLVGAASTAVYAVDVVTTLVRRARRGENLTLAHREHAYQLLAARSSHAVATCVATLAGAVNCAAAIWAWRAGIQWLGWAVVVAVCAVYELVCLGRPRKVET
ncbi:MAG: glycosyltransferase family 4 protein [Propionibacteriaceae bacterium]|jgi:UDP-N-acetylmuramyl pentapeptide phosphotransferase/UDP-N-acetylglucosamine-1-phosphate transferase|nr:glycosyltransferase family 4 protein [Propionibacteriaceae bacterium]